MTPNPYSDLPDSAYWSRSVARLRPPDVDPVGVPPFLIARKSKIATAGSCFAQHIAKALVADGYNFLITEKGPPDRNYGMYPARFGNIYSSRQLLQLFDRAFGLFIPQDNIWVRPDGAFVDPFRPQIEPAGFASFRALEADGHEHMTAVRRMFEGCDVFIFTLGLTEIWKSVSDGAVVPLAPGVIAQSACEQKYEHANTAVSEMVEDLCETITKMREINNGVHVVLTVSPVPLVATYERRHVLLSTFYSKSALRVAAEMVTQRIQGVSYFPSYEIIMGHHNRYTYFDTDLRSVSANGVAEVMRLFKRHYLTDDETAPTSTLSLYTAPINDPKMEERMRGLREVLCDEEALDL